MTDNAELVHITHAGISFDALVELMPDDEEVQIFYNGCDVTGLIKLFDSRAKYNIEQLAINAAIKQRKEKSEFNKWSDAKC